MRRAILWSLMGALMSCARGEDVSGLGFGGAGAADGGSDAAASGGDAGSSAASGGSGATAGGTAGSGGASGASGSGGASGTSGSGGNGGSSGVGSGGGSGTGGGATGIPFPYAPSNFDPAALPTHAARTVLDCGESIFDSTSLTFTNWCGQADPPTEVVTPAGGSETVVVALDGFDVASGSTLRITGDRPVVLAIFGDATFAGTVDASANGATPGAGGNLACGSSTGTNGSGSSSAGGGGGGGGGFGTKGGDGGSGDGSSVGIGGAARGGDALSPLIGGCGGGMGGGCTNVGGAGGGALQIAVAGALHVTGSVLSNGGQGTGGCGSEGGGSGGGSGGGILLEGDTVDVASGAEITANGGDGGNGRNGGGGGPGGTATSTAQNGESDGANGGGGGGGAIGRIRINAATSCTLSGAVSPAATGSC